MFSEVNENSQFLFNILISSKLIVKIEGLLIEIVMCNWRMGRSL